MVGNYTVGKKKYADVEEDVKALMARAEDIRARLLALVDADAEAFEPLSKAYAIPKEDPSREAVMEKCLRGRRRHPYGYPAAELRGYRPPPGDTG